MLICTLPIPLQKFHFPSLKKCEHRSSFKIWVGSTPWSVDCFTYFDADVEHYEAEGFAVIYKRGVEVTRWVPLEIPSCGVYRVDIHPGYPVFAVRGAGGLGSHWDTMLYSIRHGHLIQMGRPPGMNSNGPILWHGNRKVWAFDNFDRYQEMDRKGFRLARVLMKVGADGRLRMWKTVLTEHPHIPTTIRTQDDLDIPKNGL